MAFADLVPEPLNTVGQPIVAQRILLRTLVPTQNARMGARPESIDAYLAGVSAERRAMLQQLRERIHAIVPGVDECISYSMPAFRLNGHVIAGFLATKKGCSFFPFSGSTLGTVEAALQDFDRTKSALHFERQLPVSLLRTLLKARIAETSVKPAAKRRGTSRR